MELDPVDHFCKSVSEAMLTKGVIKMLIVFLILLSDIGIVIHDWGSSKVRNLF